MEFVQKTELSTSDKLQIFALWNQEYPMTLTYDSISEFEEYLNGLTNQAHIFLVDDQKIIKGWYVDFDRANERWFVIILDSKLQGSGFGTTILLRAKEQTTELNGWVISQNKYPKKNGEAYRSPLNFNLKNGFNQLPDQRLEHEEISAIKIQWSSLES